MNVYILKILAVWIFFFNFHNCDSLWRWAEEECRRQELEITRESKRKALGTLINQIRFPIMSIEEFAQGPAQSGILTDREIVELFLYFTLNPKPRVSTWDRSVWVVLFLVSSSVFPLPCCINQIKIKQISAMKSKPQLFLKLIILFLCYSSRAWVRL